MKIMKVLATPGFFLFLSSALLFSTLSCKTGAPAQPSRDVIYLNLIWHHHQPLYYPDPRSGIISRPWVRVHSTKSYYNMAAVLKDYPGVKVTFNLTPVLLRQIEAYLNGAKDKYWQLAETPAAELSAKEKEFILLRFFDANWDNVIGRFPGYRRLLTLRGDGSKASIRQALEKFTEQDLRDLQVWFNLAWFNSSLLNSEPLAGLVRKDRGFSEADKKVLFRETLRIMKEIIPLYRALQDSGQIEVTTTPYAHPILPLLYNTDLAGKADPAAQIPEERFSFPNDAIAQLSLSRERYRKDFGREARGLWPAEGAVGQDILNIVAKAGFGWMASGEQVLARSLGIGDFTRDERDTVREADLLYRPYILESRSGSEVAVVFRDLRLSDMIAFEYSGTPAREAVDDFMHRIEAIRGRLKDKGAEGPHLVTVILDGENPWEHYPNDGNEFLNRLYTALSESKTVKTTTVTEYLSMFPGQRHLDTLWWGCWFSPDYSTWIGEEEENTAWEYLRITRENLARYDIYGKKKADKEQIGKALDFMYLAEGSDWFWWYGADQDSGVDEYFDWAFRSLLTEVYKALGEEVPDFLKVPVMPQKPAQPVRSAKTPFSAQVDGTAWENEWENAGLFINESADDPGADKRAPRPVSPADHPSIDTLYYGYNSDRLFLRLDTSVNIEKLPSGSSLEIYLTTPRRREATGLTINGNPLGFHSNRFLKVELPSLSASLAHFVAYHRWEEAAFSGMAAGGGKTLEIALPWDNLGDVQPGDVFLLRAFLKIWDEESKPIPTDGPLRIVLADTGDSTIIAELDDPRGDDHGPGYYIYPEDGVFLPGVFDGKYFSFSSNQKSLIFTFQLYGPLTNPWGSGIELSLQTFDVYIDIDPGKATGRRELLEGRNCSLSDEDGWEYAVWVEGWHQKLLVSTEDGKVREIAGTPVRTIMDRENSKVTIIIPGSALQTEIPEHEWGVMACILSQEGFPSPGVRRVRDIELQPSRWRFGGAKELGKDTRIIDLLWPQGRSPTQEEQLERGSILLLPETEN